MKRRRWLETVADACERVLDRDLEASPDADHAALLEDVAALLTRLRAELDAAPP
jgi:hypothetical protein